MECPYDGCEYESSEYGVKQHHAKTHGVSLTSTELTCSGCGDVFTRPSYNVVDAEDYYCSQGCRKKDEGELQCRYDGCGYTSDAELGIQQHHKRTHGESLTVDTFECDCCGDTFERQRSKDRHFDGTFCSKDCKYEHLSDEFSERRTGEGNPMYGRDGEDHPRWRGGYDQQYGEGWATARRQALLRDHARCQNCGMSDNEHHDEFGRQLDVHHIEPVRTFDDPSDAHELDNIVTLCRRCHGAIENDSQSTPVEVQ